MKGEADIARRLNTLKFELSEAVRRANKPDSRYPYKDRQEAIAERRKVQIAELEWVLHRSPEFF